MAVYEKVTGCFSWKEAKSSDRGKILIPQKMKQCGFQLGLVRGLFPLVQETSHKSPLSPRAFQSSDAKQNCTVRQRLAGPKVHREMERKGRPSPLSHCPAPAMSFHPCRSQNTGQGKQGSGTNGCWGNAMGDSDGSEGG